MVFRFHIWVFRSPFPYLCFPVSTCQVHSLSLSGKNQQTPGRIHMHMSAIPPFKFHPSTRFYLYAFFCLLASELLVHTHNSAHSTVSYVYETNSRLPSAIIGFGNRSGRVSVTAAITVTGTLGSCQAFSTFGCHRESNPSENGERNNIRLGYPY